MIEEGARSEGRPLASRGMRLGLWPLGAREPSSSKELGVDEWNVAEDKVQWEVMGREQTQNHSSPSVYQPNQQSHC